MKPNFFHVFKQATNILFNNFLYINKLCFLFSGKANYFFPHYPETNFFSPKKSPQEYQIITALTLPADCFEHFPINIVSVVLIKT